MGRDGLLKIVPTVLSSFNQPLESLGRATIYRPPTGIEADESAVGRDKSASLPEVYDGVNCSLTEHYWGYEPGEGAP